MFTDSYDCLEKENYKIRRNEWSKCRKVTAWVQHVL